MKLRVVDMPSEPKDCLFSQEHEYGECIPYNEEPLSPYIRKILYRCCLSKNFKECENTNDCPFLDPVHIDYPMTIRSSFRGEDDD